jgi:hypothetical protein
MRPKKYGTHFCHEHERVILCGNESEGSKTLLTLSFRPKRSEAEKSCDVSRFFLNAPSSFCHSEPSQSDVSKNPT